VASGALADAAGFIVDGFVAHAIGADGEFGFPLGVVEGEGDSGDKDAEGVFALAELVGADKGAVKPVIGAGGDAEDTGAEFFFELMVFD